MKKLTAVMLSTVFVLFFAIGAHASKKGIGLGIVLGNPTGISVKNFLDKNSAVDFMVNWDFYSAGLGVHAQYLIHKYDVFKIKEGRLPFYFGIGGFAGLWNGGMWAGAQVPVGLAYEFAGDPIDIFLEVRPGILLFPGMHPNVSGGLGIRYWFD
ncbi:MAG: hypothetical protein JXR81_07240 [Candidatus Goldbacteria bacterium]|nr:hypothetical protein [Candidatus Goldiibacteriota bacterium]